MSPLQPDQEACRECGRLRALYEIQRGLEPLRQEERLRRGRWKMTAACLLGTAAFAALVRERTSILKEIAGARDAIAPPNIAAPEPGRDPAPNQAPAPAPQSQPLPAAAPAPTASLGPPPASDKLPESAVAVPSSLDPTQWAVHGRVYDLMTLRPIAGARLRFVVAGSSVLKYEAISDGDGRYLAIVARDQDYEIEASKTDYAPFALHETDIPYARLSLDKRRTIVDEVRDGDIPVSSFHDASGGESARRDVFLAPQR
jgi:hypothetical protein